MRVIRRVYNTSAFQSYDIEVPAVGTGSTSERIKRLAQIKIFIIVNESHIIPHNTIHTVTFRL